ncbi:MAG: copper amine oxidase N-terminal domain-containing protein [Defluviitaleaceae bacterium]|nr:copper amine oxidase N-terminal domain-containing protein [Defluviitaleaceae bacterium]
MKQKMVKRIFALALSFTLALAVFSPTVALADDSVVYQLATDAWIQSLDLGESGQGGDSFVSDSPFLSSAGGPTFTIVESSFGGNAIQVTGRGQNHYAVDLHLATEAWGLTNGQYTIRVRADVSDGGFWLGGADSPWAVIAGASMRDGHFEILHTFTVSGLGAAGGSARGVRIQANAGVDLTINEIVVARGTSIPDNLPSWDGQPPPADGVEEPEEVEAPEEDEDDEDYEDEEDEEEEEEEEEPEPTPTPAPPITPDPIVAPVQTTVIELQIGSTTATVNGAAHTLLAAPFISGGRTMVPVRFVAELMGAEVNWEAATRTVLIDNMSMVVDEPLPNDMGTPTIVSGATFVPVRFVSENLGAQVGWDAPTQTVTLTLNGAPAAAPAQQAQPPAQQQQAPAATAGAPTESTPGFLVGMVAEGNASTAAVVVVGTGQDVWPFAGGFEEGDVAFSPERGGTYRISFNVTNDSGWGVGGWRVRWTNDFGSFGHFTAADYTIVNDHSFAPNQVANIIPAHFNQGVDQAAGGTYTLVVDATFDGSQTFDGLVGNIALTGTAGGHDFVINWITVEQGGNVIASWVR